MKKIILTIGIAFTYLTMNAQQNAMFTHYMFNTLVVNPAYAGSRDALTITALDRAQWVDFKGAPVTQSITMHTPLRNEHIGIGLSVLNDKIGISNNTSILVDYAYIMKLSEKSKLSLGLSGGINIFSANLSTLLLDQQADPNFQNNISNHITPNVGFGVYYSRERFYVGLSAPNLIQNNYTSTNEGTTNTLIGKEQRHYFLIAGALFNLSDNLAFKPTTLIKATSAAPIQADITTTFVIMKRFSLGAMFRSGDAVGGLVGLDVTEQFHIGYSYDWSYGLMTSKYNQGSHEVLLRYDFNYSSKKQIHAPRNF